MLGVIQEGILAMDKHNVKVFLVDDVDVMMLE